MSEIFEILKLGDKELHNLFKEIVSKVNYANPSQLISDCWTEYEKQSGSKSADSSKNRNGQFLELLVQYILCKNDILPFYKQAKVAFVPNVNFDALLYTKEIGSIVLSIKFAKGKIQTSRFRSYRTKTSSPQIKNFFAHAF